MHAIFYYFCMCLVAVPGVRIGIGKIFEYTVVAMSGTTIKRSSGCNSRHVYSLYYYSNCLPHTPSGYLRVPRRAAAALHHGTYSGSTFSSIRPKSLLLVIRIVAVDLPANFSATVAATDVQPVIQAVASLRYFGLVFDDFLLQINQSTFQEAN